MKKDILQKWFYKQSPEVVWQYLTDSALLAQWLMENDFKPLVGHQFRFKTRARINFGFDGNVYCEVLEVKPYARFSYTWRGGPAKGKITLDSVVTWTFEEKDGGTELTLAHTGFKGMKNYISYIVMNKGWQMILKRMNSRMPQ